MWVNSSPVSWVLSTKIARGCCAEPSAARTSTEIARLARGFTAESYRGVRLKPDTTQAGPAKAGHYELRRGLWVMHGIVVGPRRTARPSGFVQSQRLGEMRQAFLPAALASEIDRGTLPRNCVLEPATLSLRHGHGLSQCGRPLRLQEALKHGMRARAVADAVVWCGG